MAYLVKADLYTVIYQAIIEEITRTDDTIITRAIDAGIKEVKSYLSRWDLTALFGAGATAPTVTDEWLKALTKDVVAWNIVKLANPNINYEHLRNCYMDAIKTLEKLQKGMMQPDGWPYKDTTGQTAPDGDRITYSSNTKKSTHF